MTFNSLKPAWNKLAHIPRRSLVLAGGAAVALGAAAFVSFAGDAPRQTLKADGIEVSEDASNYTVKLAEGTKVRLDGQTLRIAAANSATGVRLSQNLALPEADPSQSLQVGSENGQVVVTVPKLAPGTVPSALAQNPLQAAAQAAGFDPADAQGQIRQMHHMQQQMQKVFAQAFGADAANGGDPFAILDQLASANAPQGSSSGNSQTTTQSMHSSSGSSLVSALGGLLGGGGSVDVQDEGQDYVIHAKVPGDDLDVSVDNDRVLKITGKQQSKSGGFFQSSSQFTQMVTLPGPVQSAKIKVEKADQGFVITLPKA